MLPRGCRCMPKSHVTQCFHEINCIQPYRSAILTYMVDYAREEYQVDVLRDKATGALFRQCWRDEQGRLHRNHGLPAWIEYDLATSRPTEIQYWVHGEEHREDGLPSTQKISPETGIVYHERWTEHGVPVEGRSAVVERDPKSGNITLTMRYRASDDQWIIDYKQAGSNPPCPHVK